MFQEGSHAATFALLALAVIRRHSGAWDFARARNPRPPTKIPEVMDAEPAERRILE